MLTKVACGYEKMGYEMLHLALLTCKLLCAPNVMPNYLASVREKMILFSSNNKTDAEIITLLSVTGTSPENCQVQRLGSNTENKKR